ncbi:MAG TPA: thioredoxin [Lachnospiraceae bacterium]|jgi:thioredoxin 1|nr:thioredoxin [Lachnospiraceae bacterium]
MAALHITKENFEQEVLQSDKPVLVDFWASWCGPCRMLLPVIEELADEDTGAKICKINIDEQPELAEQFKVMTIPTLIVFKNGEVVTSSIGAKPKNEILEMLKA